MARSDGRDGRPGLRVHDLRHAYASLARRAGADLRLLQETMGHASITVTAHAHLHRSLRRRTRQYRLEHSTPPQDDARRDLP